MRYLLSTTAIVVGALYFGVPTPSYAGPATDTFCGPSSGQGCELGGEQMIFLDAAKNVLSGTGNVGSQNGLPAITVTSDGGMLQMFLDLANGFATIKPAQGKTTFNGIDFKIPGFTFTELVFDTQLTPTQSPTDTFTVEGFSGAHVSDGLGSETEAADTDKQYAIRSGVGPAFDEVNILAATGFDEIKHLEVFGVTPIAVETPEPASLTLLGFGLLGTAAFGWRRRS